MADVEPQWTHRNQKPGWDCTRPDEDHDGPCALVPVLFKERHAGHKYMGPYEICDSPEGHCHGTGVRYQGRAENGQELSDYDEVYCECIAGRTRKTLEQEADARRLNQ